MREGPAAHRQLADAYEAFERYRLDPDDPGLEALLTRAIGFLGTTVSGVARRSFMLLASVYGRQSRWEDLRRLAEQGEAARMGGLWSQHALARIALEEGDVESARRHASQGLAIRDAEGTGGQLRAELQSILRATIDEP
jgi:hypothetical protein